MLSPNNNLAFNKMMRQEKSWSFYHDKEWHPRMQAKCGDEAFQQEAISFAPTILSIQYFSLKYKYVRAYIFIKGLLVLSPFAWRLHEEIILFSFLALPFSGAENLIVIKWPWFSRSHLLPSCVCRRHFALKPSLFALESVACCPWSPRDSRQKARLD